MDPYVVSRLIVETICGAASASGRRAGTRNGKTTASSTSTRTKQPVAAKRARTAKTTKRVAKAI